MCIVQLDELDNEQREQETREFSILLKALVSKIFLSNAVNTKIN